MSSDIEPLDANGDGVGDLTLHFADRYGSGRDAYGALLLGCGDGAYLHVGTLLLGPAGGRAWVDRVPGGLLVKHDTRWPPEAPGTTSVVFAGYRLLPTTFGTAFVAEGPDRAAVMKALRRAIAAP